MIAALLLAIIIQGATAAAPLMATLRNLRMSPVPEHSLSPVNP
jgi:hypothetical protein